MEFYEAAPGLHLIVGVSLDEHRAAVASNYEGPQDFDRPDFGRPATADSKELWYTLDDREIPYDKLDPVHLLNISSMLERNGKAYHFPKLMARAEALLNPTTKKR